MAPQDDPQLPPDLIAEFRRHDARPLPDTAALDEQVRTLAAQHFAGSALDAAPRRSPWVLRGRVIAGSLAAAALLGLAVWLGRDPAPPSAATAPLAQSSALPHDFNADGQVNILDVLHLAQKLDAPSEIPRRSGGMPEGLSGGLSGGGLRGDVNGDGVVDRADLEALTRSIVQVVNDKTQSPKGAA